MYLPCRDNDHNRGNSSARPHSSRDLGDLRPSSWWWFSFWSLSWCYPSLHWRRSFVSDYPPKLLRFSPRLWLNLTLATSRFLIQPMQVVPWYQTISMVPSIETNSFQLSLSYFRVSPAKIQCVCVCVCVFLLLFVVQISKGRETNMNGEKKRVNFNPLKSFFIDNFFFIDRPSVCDPKQKNQLSYFFLYIFVRHQRYE